MPNIIQHPFQSEYKDWTVTSLFYSALHLIDEYCAKCNTSVRNHTERRNFVNTSLKPISNYYHRLYLLSTTVRYDAQYSDIKESEVREAQDLLSKIENYIASLTRN